jgi:hypothetical protein
LICLNKDFIKLIFSKLEMDDFYDLLIFNKLTLCQNFYACLKSFNTGKVSSNFTKSENELKILNLLGKCLESVLINRKQSLILDSTSYLLLLIIYNLYKLKFIFYFLGPAMFMK